jgi:hypothetical protein
MTRTLISLTPMAAVIAIFGVQVLLTRRRRKREDRQTAERIEAAVASYGRAARAYIAWLEERFAAEASQQFPGQPRTPGRPQ